MTVVGSGWRDWVGDRAGCGIKKVLHKYDQILIIVNSVSLDLFQNFPKFSIKQV